MHPMLAGQFQTGLGCRTLRDPFRQLENFFPINKLIPGKSEFRQNEEFAFHRTQPGSRLLKVAVHFPECRLRLEIADFHQ